MEPVRTRAIRAMLDGHDGILSFDVFDTLLWRRTPRPIDVFHDIPRVAARAGIKLPAISGVQYGATRKRAESTARVRVAEEFGTGEVTLAQVLEQLVIDLGWDLDDAALLDSLVAAELAAEADALVADHELLQLVRDEAATGRRMVVVSDSYLSPGHIGGLLTGAGYPEDAFERTFVSSSFGVSKATGLFEIVAKELDVHPARILHLGDNVGADVKPLRDIGGRSSRWAVARDEAIAMTARETGTDVLPMRVATIDGEPTASDAGVTSLRARLIPPDDMTDARDRILTGYERFGRLVYGPSLIGFANWICTRAADLGLDRLYCFQREGQLLAEIIERVAAVRGQPLRTDVIAVSRAALAPARHAQVNVHYLADLIYGRRPRKAGEIVQEIGLGELGVDGWSGDRLVTMHDADELFRLVAGDGPRLRLVQDDLDRRRASLHRYLRGAVSIDATQIGVVDLGWAGSIQKSLSLGLAQIGFAGTVRGLYLATNAGAEQHLTSTNRNEGFVANLGSPEGFEPVFRNLEVIEQSCLERTGSVVGYDDDGTVRRAHDDISPEQWHAIQRVQDGVRFCVHEWAAHEPPPRSLRPDDADVWRVVTRQVLTRFCADPTREEIELFRGWRHDDNKGTRSVEQMIPRVFEERSPAAAILAGALEMDELLWASAVETLNGGAIESVPVPVRASVKDQGHGRTVPAINAVGRRSGNLVAVYVGGEARRLGAVRVSIGTGPAIVTIKRITVEGEAGDDSMLERYTTFRQIRRGRGASVIADGMAVVKGGSLRLSVPLTAFGMRLLADQRVRVLIELDVDNFHPIPSPVARIAKAGSTAATRWAVERGVSQATELVPTAMKVARSAGGGKAAREVLGSAKKALSKLGGRDLLR
jgi:FMN phosphatase YigB (HAD superfamily)